MDDHATAQAEQDSDDAARLRRALRASLRLIFEPNLAERLAAAGGDPPDLRRVVRLATRQYRLLQLQNTLFPHRHPSSTSGAAPLAARLSLGARAALGLALRLGLDLEPGALARMLGTTPEDLAREMERARLAAEPDLPPGCGEQDVPVRAALPLALPERMALIGHLRRCPECRRAIAAREALDARLRAAIEAEAEQLADAPGPAANGRDWRLGSGWLGAVLVGVLLGALLLLGAAAAIDRLARHGGAATLAGAAAPRPSGWLLQRTRDNELQAVDTASGEVRKLASLPTVVGSAQPVISPGRDLIAVGYVNPAMQSLEFRRLNGELIASHLFQSSPQASDAYYVSDSGWLGDAAFLLTERPLYLNGESQAAYAARAAGQTRLVAVGVDGSERQLFQGDVCAVSPSPDGTLIALDLCDASGLVDALELRPVTPAGLGPPLARLPHQLDSNQIVWAPDSSRCFFASLSGATASSEAAVTATPALDAPPPRPEPHTLYALDRDGRAENLWETTAAALYPVTISPDGATLVLASVDSYSPPSAAQMTTVHYRRLALQGGTAVPLAAVEQWNDGGNPLWSPDGRTLLLTVVRPFFLAQGTPDASSAPGANLVAELIAFDQSWTATPFMTSFDLYASTTIAWLPENALPRQRPQPRSGLAGALVQATAPGLAVDRLDAGSSVAPGGRYLVLTDDSLHIPAVWSAASHSERRLPAEASDLAWLPGGDGLIGVAPAADSQGGSRLIFFAPEYPTDSYPLDFQSFNPAGLGLRSDAVYARPLVAPGDNLLSFFVVDPSRQRVTLWLAGWELAARPVLAWPAPAGALATLPPVAAWVDGRTLLVVRPDDWQGGLPRTATLLRVGLDASGTVAVSPLRSLSGHGSDRGLALTELALSPDGTQLAFRLRHLTGSSIDGAGYDTLAVAPAADLSRTLELAHGRTRATAAEGGLAWSPDGGWLAAGLDGRVELLAADGSATLMLTPVNKEAGYPLWLGDNLWLSLTGEDGRHIWQVPIH